MSVETKSKGATDTRPLVNLAEKLVRELGQADQCLACGACASRCPASGQAGMDPRRFVHLVLTGRAAEAAASPWVWMCSLCQRCRWACPMDVDIPALVYQARRSWPREQRPKGIVGSCDKALQSESLSAMGLPTDDWTWVVEDILEEVHDDQPQWKELVAPMDQQGAHFFLNENSRGPGTEPEEMVPLWKILHHVGADWTYSSQAWAGENYCMFLADDEGWKKINQAKAEAFERLGCKVWLNTECGHEFFAQRAGNERFAIEPQFPVRHIVEYYAQWIREGKLEVSSDWNAENPVSFTVQDPCQLVRKSLGDSVADDLRFVLKTCVGEENFIEVFPNRSNNYCCGGGGGYLQSGYNDARFHYGKRKFDQIVETGADYCVTPCHNCHQQIEEIAEHFEGKYKTVHLWTVICLAMGWLAPSERKYLGPDLAEVNLPSL
jgi:Fe-S oxidoreductase